MRSSLPRATALAAALLAAGGFVGPAPAQEAAQDNPDLRVARVEVRPAELTIHVGERAPIEIVAVEADGRPVEGADLLGSSNGAEVSFDPVASEVRGLAPGVTTVGARIRRPVPEGPGFETLRGSARVTVLPRPVVRVELEDPPTRVYAGTRIRLAASAWSEVAEREDARVRWESDDPRVAEAAPGGLVRAVAPGSVRITATAEGVAATAPLRVVESPIRGVRLTPERSATRVGDVLRLRARAVDGEGRPVPDAPIEWSWEGLDGQPYDAAWLQSEIPGEVVAVLHDPGLYRITASVGGHAADAVVEAGPREVAREVRLVAHAPLPLGQAATDLWVFEGLDGRDYVYTGTFSGNLLYAWDVTDPGAPVLTDSLAFDGRRVNDVKVNAGRTLAVVTSENASTRRNGITVVDIREPARPRRVSHYTEGLTGGVHNTWIVGDLVYAIHYGTRDMHIIDISDPAEPREVGRWGLDKEDKFLHDVTVQDGLAYLSYWDDGVVILDVGAGIAGGTPTEPALVSRYAYRYELEGEKYTNTHHAIRYGDYVFAGDEIFGCAACDNGPRGYIHVLDVSDLEHPREVAWYRVPEAGSHNMWAEDDKLYIGYYQGGLRVVDIGGELRGDLYRQGREIARYFTEDATGTVPNATDTWGAQPYEGHIFATDGSSGLWVVELVEPERAPVP